MHLAYSAFSLHNNARQNTNGITESDLLLRYKAYQTACNKYSREINAIKKYLPGWTPKFR